jgi:hypothetical protein
MIGRRQTQILLVFPKSASISVNLRPSKDLSVNQGKALNSHYLGENSLKEELV